MKWFHHECAARHDPKLQILGSTHGAEGLGIYWGLLEEIGQHSDLFHLKISGISEELDQMFQDLVQIPAEHQKYFGDIVLTPIAIPRLPVKILAKNLFTSQRKLIAVIDTCVEIGLFENTKWSDFHMLYSPPFEHRADDYTQRIRRKQTSNTGERSNKLRTNSELSPDILRRQSEEASNLLRTKSDNVPLDTDTEQIQNQKRIEEEKDAKDAANKNNLSTFPQKLSPPQYEQLKNESHLIELNEGEFREYSSEFISRISKWNELNTSKFDWIPTVGELHKLFYGGNHQHKVAMCYHAYQLLSKKIHYPELVLRALHLMLKSSEQTRVVNPFGWLWSCLHGNGNGTTPWVQLLTAEEESNLTSLRKRRSTFQTPSNDSSHPP